MKNLLIILIVLFAAGCGNSSKELNSSIFSPPVLINTLECDTVKNIKLEAHFLCEVFPTVIGKFKNRDTIDVNPMMRDTNMYKDFIWDFSRLNIDDSLDVNGFEIFVDYKTTIYYNSFFEWSKSLLSHYPIYFINSSKSDKVFFGKDSHAFGIQESQDSNYFPNWLPIEAKGYDFCGNGRWGIIVHPNEYIVVLMQKYKGDFDTQLRVRFQNGESIYVSKPFRGSINYEQFTIKDSSFVQRQLEETNGLAGFSLFYGAVPKRDDWAVTTVLY